MSAVKVTQAELAALDSMIEILQEKGSPRDKKVPLQNVARPILVAAVTTVTTITGAGTRVFAEDAKILAELEKLTTKLRSEISLADLLELRKRATVKKD